MNKKLESTSIISNSITLTVNGSTENSVDFYYELLPGSLNFATKFYMFGIFECDSTTSDLDGQTGRFYYFSNLVKPREADNKTLTGKPDIGDDLSLEKGKLYALCLCIKQKDSNQGTEMDMSNIAYFILPDESSTINVPENQNTLITIYKPDTSYTIEVNYQIPEKSLGGDPKYCKHSLRLYKVSQNDLFVGDEYTKTGKGVKNWEAEQPIDSNKRKSDDDKPVVFGTSYENLESGEHYTIAYCLPESVETITNSCNDTECHYQHFAATLEFEVDNY